MICERPAFEGLDNIYYVVRKLKHLDAIAEICLLKRKKLSIS